MTSGGYPPPQPDPQNPGAYPGGAPQYGTQPGFGQQPADYTQQFSGPIDGYGHDSGGQYGAPQYGAPQNGGGQYGSLSTVLRRATSSVRRSRVHLSTALRSTVRHPADSSSAGHPASPPPHPDSVRRSPGSCCHVSGLASSTG